MTALRAGHLSLNYFEVCHHSIIRSRDFRIVPEHSIGTLNSTIFCKRPVSENPIGDDHAARSDPSVRRGRVTRCAPP